MSISLYILLNPIGVLNAEQQIKVYFGDTQSQKILIIANRIKFNANAWDKVFHINHKYILTNGFVNNVIKAIFYRITLKKIQNQIQLNGVNHIDIYFQNLQCPLTNYIFFNSTNIFGSEIKISFNIIEEGIGNYYEYFDVYPKEKKRLLIKKLFYSFFGLKISLPNSQTGATYDTVKKIFVNIPHLSISPDKSLPLNINKVNINPLKDSILILGQESEAFIYGKTKYLNNVKELIYIVKGKFSNQKIIYKPHWDNRINGIEEFLKEVEKDIEYVKSHDSIENLILELKPSKIISFSTSAFLTLRIMLDDDTNSRLEMFYFDIFGIPKEIIDVFESLNVRDLENK